MMICTKRAYVAKDGNRIVEQGDDAATLLCGAGRRIAEAKLKDLEGAEDFFRLEVEADLKPVSITAVPPVSSKNILSSGETVTDSDLLKIEKQGDDGGESESSPELKPDKKAKGKRC